MGLPSLLSPIKFTRYTTAASEIKAPLCGMGKFYIMITWVLPGFFFVCLFVCFAFCCFMPMAHFEGPSRLCVPVLNGSYVSNIYTACWLRESARLAF